MERKIRYRLMQIVVCFLLCATCFTQTVQADTAGETGEDGNGTISPIITILLDDSPPPPEIPVWYQDSDGDTFGNPNVYQESTEQPEGYVLDNRDCDDTDPSILVNCPPVAGPYSDYNLPYVYEDQLTVLQLVFSDPENDPLDVIVKSLSDTENSLTGRLFQYDEELAAGNHSAIDSADEITIFPTTLTDPGGRMIFLSDPNANTQGLPSKYKSYPDFEFYVQETDCCDDGVEGDGPHSSSVANPPIWIESVNDAPTLWDTSDSPGFCFHHCTFEKNCGEQMISAGADDIEGSILTLIVTDVNCPAGTLFVVNSDGTKGAEVTESTTVSDLFPGILSPAFYFEPLADETGSPYCTVSYKISDGELSSSEFTITIDVQ